MPDQLTEIHREILAGVENESKRIDNARENADFFRGTFPADFDARRSSSNWQGARYRRDSRIMTWLVETLASDLYRHGPTRTLAENEPATEWLGAIYKANATDALLQSADEWAAVSQVCAVQAMATEDPRRPVRHVLWPAHQLYIWDSLDEPLTPAAVATVDRWDNTRRLRLWTAETYSVYQTTKLQPLQTAGATAYNLVSKGANPFGLIPFAFVHYNFPTVEFWSGGPGDAFRELNDYLNSGITEVGDSLRYTAKPILQLSNVRPGWRPTTPVQPGDIWNLPPDTDADGTNLEPRAEYLVPDMAFVEAHWADIQSYLDHSMQCADVPPAAFRMVQDSARSGLSIVAERLPLVSRAERRQRPAGYYERQLAMVTLAVGSRHLGNNAELLEDGTMRVTSSMLATAADDPDLGLRWPSMKPKLTGEAANAEDDFRLANRMKSRTQILMERDDMTREEAEEYLEQTAKDLEREAALMPEPDPPVVDDQNQPPDEQTSEALPGDE